MHRQSGAGLLVTASSGEEEWHDLDLPPEPRGAPSIGLDEHVEAGVLSSPGRAVLNDGRGEQTGGTGHIADSRQFDLGVVGQAEQITDPDRELAALIVAHHRPQPVGGPI
jgi:hypothetical protein